MDENQNKPEENLPQKGQQQIPPAQTTESSTKQPNEMEVHSHGHVHEKKKWKEYVFQFIMLLLAVILGFWAENLREKNEESNKEEEYMHSLISDIEKDSAMMVEAELFILKQIREIDTLQELFSSNLQNGSAEVQKCYSLTNYIMQYYPVIFNEGTVSQLTSSGSMRMIKKRGVADSVMSYYNLIRGSEKQGQFYTGGINECLNVMYNVYDIDYLRTKFIKLPDTTIVGKDTTITEKDVIIHVKPNATSLLSTDPLQLRKLNAVMEGTKISANNFLAQLDQVFFQAERLLVFLRGKYE